MSYFAQGADAAEDDDQRDVIEIDDGRREQGRVVIADLDGDDDACSAPIPMTRKSSCTRTRTRPATALVGRHGIPRGRGVLSVELFDVDGDGDLDFVGAVEEENGLVEKADGACASAFAKDGFTVDADAEEDMTTVVASTSTRTATSTSSRPRPISSPGTRTTAPPRPAGANGGLHHLAERRSRSSRRRVLRLAQPTHPPTERPTMKQFHCAENASTDAQSRRAYC